MLLGGDRGDHSDSASNFPEPHPVHLCPCQILQELKFGLYEWIPDSRPGGGRHLKKGSEVILCDLSGCAPAYI